MQTLHAKRLSVHNKAPFETSLNDNNKLSAQSYVLIPTMEETIPTDNSIANTVDLPYQTPSDTPRKTPTTTVAPTLRQHVHHQRNNSVQIDHLSVNCRIQITVHLPTVTLTIKTATNPTLQTLSATTAADSVTIPATAPTQHAIQLPIEAHLLDHLRTMKIPLPAINNEPTLLLTQEKTCKKLFITKLSVLHLLTQWMTLLTQSLGQTQPSPKWRSINTSLIKTFNLLAITLLPTLEPQTISLMIHNLLINVLAHLILRIGFLTVVQPATTHQFSVTSMMSHPAVYLSPLLMAVLNCLPTKAPQNVPSLLMMV
jgi:hypothetical protein